MAASLGDLQQRVTCQVIDKSVCTTVPCIPHCTITPLRMVGVLSDVLCSVKSTNYGTLLVVKFTP